MQCRQAAKCFLGSHDFTQFASTYPLGMNPRKTLTRFEVVEVRPGFLRLEVQGSGFLYRMVRHMVRPDCGCVQPMTLFAELQTGQQPNETFSSTCLLTQTPT